MVNEVLVNGLSDFLVTGGIGMNTIGRFIEGLPPTPSSRKGISGTFS